MENIIDFLLGIPATIGQFGNWLVTPLGHGLDISPLGLFGVGGVAVIISIIGVHIVRLFI